jgi:type II secretory pathway pseudopilin PulG
VRARAERRCGADVHAAGARVIRARTHARAAACGSDGFLLLEALIGLAIMGLVAIALLAATSSQVRTADKAAVLLVASALAQDRMASVQLLDHEGLSDFPDSLVAGTFPPPFEDFSWTAEVAESEDENDLFAVRVEVKGRGEAFPTETLLHRPAVVVTAGGAQGGRGGAAAGPGRGAGGRGRGGDAAGPGGGGRGRGDQGVGAGARGGGPGRAGPGRGGPGRAGGGTAGRGGRIGVVPPGGGGP